MTKVISIIFSLKLFFIINNIVLSLEIRQLMPEELSVLTFYSLKISKPTSSTKNPVTIRALSDWERYELCAAFYRKMNFPIIYPSETLAESHREFSFFATIEIFIKDPFTEDVFVIRKEAMACRQSSETTINFPGIPIIFEIPDYYVTGIPHLGAVMFHRIRPDVMRNPLYASKLILGNEKVVIPVHPTHLVTGVNYADIGRNPRTYPPGYAAPAA